MKKLRYVVLGIFVILFSGCVVTEIVVIPVKGATVSDWHLESISVNSFDIISAGQKMGTVGDSGNAKGKPPHVHYSIVSLLPYPWRMTLETQGWKKMFYLDPNEFLIPKQAL
jgi:hypothetical protein